MELHEYNLLETDAKIVVLADKGIYLLYRAEGRYIVNLFSLYRFYVEVWYIKDSEKIELIKAFKSINALDSYLSEIEIG